MIHANFKPNTVCAANTMNNFLHFIFHIFFICQNVEMQSLALALPGSQVHISVCVFLVTLCVLLVRFKTGKWLHSVRGSGIM